MLFNSIDFALFLPIVFILYWFVFERNLKYQNFFIVVVSYVFYGWWDWRFLFLILFSTVLDFLIGKKLKRERKQFNRKVLLFISILVNLGFLGFFKYYNFFLDSLSDAFTLFGRPIEIDTLNIILPVGISFYTFQTLSYSIDVYRKKLQPTDHFISFAAFVCFFPQLVAGPIERATNLLPQILNKRKFSSNLAIQGSKLIIWGLFKKVVIADSLAFYVNSSFSNYETYSGLELWLSMIYFSIQIYCDFSGYSDIAIGTSKLFGFNLMTNFKTPYFSRNISEFWSRWHISLSTWFKDYLYIPLGGSREGKFKSFRNILIIFTVSGFWHGANFTFIAWGVLHALFYLPSFLFSTNKKFSSDVVASETFLPSAIEVFYILKTYFFVLVAWVFFRSDKISIAFEYLTIMFTNFNLKINNYGGVSYLIIFICLDWLVRKNPRNPSFSKIYIIRYLIFIFMFYQILVHFGRVSSDFIYFQF
ncbi:MBOAT family O-acyltransferase [uncultured Polaribacter sp.]|uniref:MBOAT family O-acyltransferase n=1 Tax=uncultured Polaribacter sp. TaxID=174711 RepID=UPI00259BDDAB|nr:MBOAT family O-acyltransferase [uncultured Polaribacter sp.]